jgi:hypothetical protein
MGFRDIENIHHSSKTHNSRDVDQSFSKNPRRNSSHEKKKVMDYIETVKKRAASTNEHFIRKNLPYRLRVYTVGRRAFIGLAIYDGNNKVINNVVRDITEADFGTVMDNLSTGSGLLFDSMPK